MLETPEAIIEIQGHFKTYRQLENYLNSTTWLDDLVINQYLFLLKDLISNSSIRLFSSFEFELVTKLTDADSTELISKVLRKHSCIMPINMNKHWFAVHFLPHCRVLRVYDSLYSKNMILEDIFRKFWELVKKEKGWRGELEIEYPTTATQNDGHSCGLYTLSFIKSIFTNVPFTDLTDHKDSVRYHIITSILKNRIN